MRFCGLLRGPLGSRRAGLGVRRAGPCSKNCANARGILRFSKSTHYRFSEGPSRWPQVAPASPRWPEHPQVVPGAAGGTSSPRGPRPQVAPRSPASTTCLGAGGGAQVALGSPRWPQAPLGGPGHPRLPQAVPGSPSMLGSVAPSGTRWPPQGAGRPTWRQLVRDSSRWRQVAPAPPGDPRRPQAAPRCPQVVQGGRRQPPVAAQVVSGNLGALGSPR